MIALVRRRTLAAVVALALAAVAAMPAAAQPGRPPNLLAVPVVGALPGGGNFTGTFSLTSFAVQQGQLVARGLLSGVLTNAGTATTVVSSVALPVSALGSTCDILHLDIAPISLNLLGLQVNLSEIVLDITAQSGPGNLLGNLLCSVAGLLDSPGGLARLLNQILGILGGL
jgi:hypothetical protein